MSIASEITRLNNAKAAIKQSLTNKGVEVSDESKLDEYPAFIDSIPMEGGNPYYEDLYNLRTNNGTDMTGLFAYCTASELDLSNLDTSNVTNMSHMFDNCSSSVNTEGWDTSNVANMSLMFSYFTGSIDISQLDTSNVTKVSYMFNSANTDKIILTGLNFPKCTNMTNMFASATGTILDLSSWDISNITNISNMLTGAFKKIDLTGWNTNHVTNMSQIFYRYNNPLEELIIPDWDMTNAGSTNIFYNSSYIKNLKLIDLSRSDDATITKIASFLPTRTATTSGTVLVPANTSQEVCDTLAAKYWTAQKPEAPEEPPVEDIPLYVQGEFNNKGNITEVNTMVNDTHTDLRLMFGNCINLTTINGIEKWDTSNVTDMSAMFNYDAKLITLDLSSFNTSKVTDMSFMFNYCSNLEEVDLRNFDIRNTTSVNAMFNGCYELHTLRLDNCNNTTISKITTSTFLPTGTVNGTTRIIYCKEENVAGLTVPNGWEFVFVD